MIQTAKPSQHNPEGVHLTKLLLVYFFQLNCVLQDPDLVPAHHGQLPCGVRIFWGLAGPEGVGLVCRSCCKTSCRCFYPVHPVWRVLARLSVPPPPLLHSHCPSWRYSARHSQLGWSCLTVSTYHNSLPYCHLVVRGLLPRWFGRCTPILGGTSHPVTAPHTLPRTPSVRQDMLLTS